MQTVGSPRTGAGAAKTVTVAVAEQPPGIVYVMSEVPGIIPVTTPVPETTDATEDVPLDHVPPDVASASVTEEPTQMAVVPVMGELAFTVTGLVAMHPPME